MNREDSAEVEDKQINCEEAKGLKYETLGLLAMIGNMINSGLYALSYFLEGIMINI